jgi:asparagine synthase (glutamine-hydrolysing)
LEENAAVVREAVDRVVKMRLRADVPVGVYLSGGLDSSIIAASMAKQHRGPIKAFTISFPDDENFDELGTAERMAEKIGAELHSVSCDHQSMLEHVEDCLWVSELPFHNLHSVGKFLLSRLAREHVKVVLTGEGADETFLGYICFQPDRGAISDQMGNSLKAKKVHRKTHVQKILSAIGFVPLHEHAELFSTLHQRVINNVFHVNRRSRLIGSHPLSRLTRRLRSGQTENRSIPRKIQYFWIKSMLATYNLTVIGDRQEMAHSIEGRPPFLDHRLFERMRWIPDDQKIHSGIEKAVLREAYKDEVTDEVYRNRKWPFSAPPLWLKKGVYPKLDDVLDRYLSKEAIERSGIFNYAIIRCLRFFSRVLFVDCKLRRRLNELSTLILTVQILDQLFVRKFEQNMDKRRARTMVPSCEMTAVDFSYARKAKEPIAV